MFKSEVAKRVLAVKRMLAPLAVAAVFVLAGVLCQHTRAEAGTVNLTLPYLYTDGLMVTYCMVSNLNPDNTTSDNSTTATFKVMTKETGGAAQTAHSIASQYAPMSGFTRMLYFSKNSIYNRNGTVVASLSDELPSGTITAYSGVLTITSSTATCKTIVMSCLQTQSGVVEKRFVGYTCDDGTNLVGY
ncbi:MAG: hypothetical protein HQK98_08090 [Nitrospirae bacterium]|nr:hypothetical protein [Nitrospirota bacterium]